MMSEAIILAKKPDDPNTFREEETLIGHTNCVLKSFRSIFGNLNQPTDIASAWFRFFKIEEPAHIKKFYQNGLAACCFHDMGKANRDFQYAVRRQGYRQGFRHEHLSAFILYIHEVEAWLHENPDLDHDILCSAVLTHHLKASSEEIGNPQNPECGEILFSIKGIKTIFACASTLFPESSTISLSIEPVWSCNDSGSLRDTVQKLKRRFHLMKRKLRENETLNSLLSAVRAALIVSDSAGSGLPRENINIVLWIEQALGGRTLSSQFIEENVIKPRLQQIQAKGTRFRWSDFQEASEGLNARSLLIAPCGSGKTLAAWRWIKGRLAKNPAARIIFLYPTRATATEGFRDYVSWAPEADAALMHGTSSYELENLFINPAEGREEKDYSVQKRLFALDYWRKRIFSATVDQFLGFMQYDYASICLLPVLVDSIVVIDEVHSFDRKLFSVLQKFLQAFDLPVLCMTASLTSYRISKLRACGLDVFPKDQTNFKDLLDKAQKPRYRMTYLDSIEEACRTAAEAFSRRKRVLFVVNTVDRCQQIASTVTGKESTLCYHSRFKLEDRKEMHQKVIRAFQQKKKPAFAVTTQVCEMSLDLDADVLITEVAPMASLIQRMGRCNRHTDSGSTRIGEVYIYKPEAILPYSEEELEGVDRFISTLCEKESSQAELQELLEEFGPAHVEVNRYAAFLESGPWAVSREDSLRDASGYSVRAILDSDIERFLMLKEKRKAIDGLILNAPANMAERDKRLGRHIRTVPGAFYTEELGLTKGPAGKNEE